jgi:excisionase family DNA binding protein
MNQPHSAVAAAQSSTADRPRPSRDQPSLLTVPEACDALRISKHSLYQLIRQRRLATIKIGTRRLIPAESLRDLVGALVREERAS